MNYLQTLAASTLLMTFVGCAQFGSLHGDIPTQASEPASMDSSDAVLPIPEVNDVVTASETHSPRASLPAPQGTSKDENAKALADCINQWPGLSEVTELAKKAVVIELNQFRAGDLVHEDLQQTTEPVMYLLNLNFDIPDRGQIQLRNNKGWYCLAIRTKTVNDFEIGVSCQTVIATATASRQIFNQFNITRDAPCL